MVQLLPIEILDWVNPKDFNLNNYSKDSPIGCFLEVHLDYPDELHDLHNDYPLAGKKIKVRKEMLSHYKSQIIGDNNFSLGYNKEFIPNLGNKRKYKLHYQNMKLYFSLELQLKKIYRKLEFKQQPFLKPYIKCNAELQREAEKEGNKIKKQNAKLRNNATFGKSIENSMNKLDVTIVTRRKQYLKWSFRPTIKREKPFRNVALISINQFILEQAY